MSKCCDTFRRPTGSERTVLVTGLEQVKSNNPDHIGGYALAVPIISGKVFAKNSNFRWLSYKIRIDSRN